MEKLCTIKCHSTQSKAHLAAFMSEVHAKQTEVFTVNQLHLSPCMGLYGSLYDYVIHLVLIAIMVISGFQPPLELRHASQTVKFIHISQSLYTGIQR